MEKQGSAALLAALVILLAVAAVILRLHPILRLLLIIAAGAMGYRAAHALGWVRRERTGTDEVGPDRPPRNE